MKEVTHSGPVDYDTSDGHITITMPYSQAKQVIVNARKEMNKILGKPIGSPPPSERKDMDLGPIVIKNIKFIQSVTCNYVGDDIPQMDLETGTPTPPQQLSVTLTYCRL